MTGNDNDSDNDSDSDSESSCDFESPPPSDAEGEGKGEGEDKDKEVQENPPKKEFSIARALADRPGKRRLPSSPSSSRKAISKNSRAIELKLSRLERKRQLREMRQRIKRKRRSPEDSDSDNDSDSDSDSNIDSDSDLDDATNTPVRAFARKDTGKTSTTGSSPDSKPLASTAKPKGTTTPATATRRIQPFSSSARTATNGLGAASGMGTAAVASASANASANANASGSATQTFTYLSSDDSDAEDLASSAARSRASELPYNLPPETVAAIRRAQASKTRLEQAQQYKAQDLHVAVEQPVYVPTIKPPTATTTHGSRAAILGGYKTNKVNMGETLEFVCRCGHILVGGLKQTTQKDKQSITLTLREREPLSVLVDKFCATHNLPRETATISMVFDGEKLDTSKTPIFYEMEDGFLIDFSASATRSLTVIEQQQRSQQHQLQKIATNAVAKKGNSVSLGESMEFTCHVQIKVKAPDPIPQPAGRRSKRQKLDSITNHAHSITSKLQRVTKKVTMRENESIQLLATRLGSLLGNLSLATTKMTLKFDGSSLDVNKTPKFYEMMTGDMIEVYVENEEPQQTHNAVAGSAGVPAYFPVNNTRRISLTLRRQKGRIRSDVTLELWRGEALSILMERYKQQLGTNGNSSNSSNNRRSTRSSARARACADSELVFQRQGTTLDLSKTPADYNLGQGDQIDVVEAVSLVSTFPGTNKSSTIEENGETAAGKYWKEKTARKEAILPVKV
eukprot:jgi/Psemu1/12535/gm1.12535_g